MVLIKLSGRRVTELVVIAFLTAVLLGPGAVAVPTLLSQPVMALGNGSTTTQHLGFDAQCAPTIDQMQTLWTNSPWWWVGVYAGGVNVTCKTNTNLTASWLNSARNQGWLFAFFWVGEQAPCNSGNYYLMSSDTSTAASQGQNNASAFYNQMTGTLGVTGQANGTPLTYDLEGYGQPAPGSTCQLAVNAFISRFTTWLHYSPPQLVGVYGSTCSSNLDVLAGVSPVIDYIHGAQWNNDPDTNHMQCVATSHWIYHQRLKQFTVNQDAGQYGVPGLNVDYDCGNGPVAPSGGQSGQNCP
jgi:hypothetical protein